jgi:small subunit ribosomal protein S7
VEERTDQDHNLHVSEEAKVIAKSKGEQGPDLTQGTPVEEVVKGDKDAQEHLPKVIKDSLKKGDNPSGTRSYSTMAMRKPTNSRSMSTFARRQQPAMTMMPSGGFEQAIVESGMQSMTDIALKEPRLRVRHLHNRHQNIVEQMVGLLIKDGKKAAAQRVRQSSCYEDTKAILIHTQNVALVLSHLRTAPPPKLDTARLIPGHPQAAHLPLSPVLYLQLAIDSVAPILRIKQLKGQAGGGMALAVPVPLSLRRRRWEAIHWIIDAASKKRSRGSGKNMFAQKIAEEVVSVVEGRSGAWQKRDALHKLAVAARANMKAPARR